MPSSFDPLPFQIDHVIAQKHGGLSTLDNLALSCFHCNSHKGPNIAGLDPEGGALMRLYHPCLDEWTEHFTWHGAILVGLTSIGRTTVRVLVINHQEQIAVRRSLINEGVFPPP
jgi:hypothetical protein